MLSEKYYDERVDSPLDLTEEEANLLHEIRCFADEQQLYRTLVAGFSSKRDVNEKRICIVYLLDYSVQDRTIHEYDKYGIMWPCFCNAVHSEKMIIFPSNLDKWESVYGRTVIAVNTLLTTYKNTTFAFYLLDKDIFYKECKDIIGRVEKSRMQKYVFNKEKKPMSKPLF